MTTDTHPKPDPERKTLSAAPLESYSPEDRAFFAFWYGHMRDDLMQPPLADISHSTARYIWDAALASLRGAALLPQMPTVIELDGGEAVRYAWKHHKYAQGTSTCIAFWRGAQWAAAQIATPPGLEGDSQKDANHG